MILNTEKDPSYLQTKPHISTYFVISAGQLHLLLSFCLTYYFMKSQLQSGDNLLLFKPPIVVRFLFPLLFHLPAERAIGDSFQS